jgi:hypothetical protein
MRIGDAGFNEAAVHALTGAKVRSIGHARGDAGVTATPRGTTVAARLAFRV